MATPFRERQTNANVGVAQDGVPWPPPPTTAKKARRPRAAANNASSSSSSSSSSISHDLENETGRQEENRGSSTKLLEQLISTVGQLEESIKGLHKDLRRGEKRMRRMEHVVSTLVEATGQDFAQIQERLKADNERLRKVFKKTLPFVQLSSADEQGGKEIAAQIGELDLPHEEHEGAGLQINQLEVASMNNDDNDDDDFHHGGNSDQEQEEEEEEEEDQEEKQRKMYEALKEPFDKWFLASGSQRIPMVFTFLAAKNMNPRPYSNSKSGKRRDKDMKQRAAFVQRYYKNKMQRLPLWSELIKDYLDYAEASEHREISFPVNFNAFSVDAVNAGLKQSYATFQARLMDSFRKTVTLKHENDDRLRQEWTAILEHVFDEKELTVPFRAEEEQEQSDSSDSDDE